MHVDFPLHGLSDRSSVVYATAKAASAHSCGSLRFPLEAGSASALFVSPPEDCFAWKPWLPQWQRVPAATRGRFDALSPVRQPSNADDSHCLLQRTPARRSGRRVDAFPKSSGREDRPHDAPKAAEYGAWPFGPPAVVQFDQVAKSFPRNRLFAAPSEVVALEETTLTLHGPGPIALVGDSGSGKTTFMNLMCGRIMPTRGTLSFRTVAEASTDGQGNPPHVQPQATPAKAHTAAVADDGQTATQGVSTAPCAPRGVAFINRSTLLEMMARTPSTSVAQALASAFERSGSPRKRVRAPSRRRVAGVDFLSEILLKAADLGNARNRRCEDLGRGQWLCLVLCTMAASAFAERESAGAFAKEDTGRGSAETGGETPPGPVLCLDEFLEFEDARVRRVVERACVRLCAAGITIVFATHKMDHVEGMLSTRPGADEVGTARVGTKGNGGGHDKKRAAPVVIAFAKGRAGAQCPLDMSTYVAWKRGESEQRRARTIM